MPLIKILPESLRNKIAAGEVVERPSSVVKELIENSIDAGSLSIDVGIAGAGKKLIRVTDNGSGMGSEDVQRSFLRHATSKIDNEKDLFNLFTLGFRGEALSSIAAVSRITITSADQSCEGLSVEISGGEVKGIKPAAVRGTVIEVRDLFFNTPARLKFLRSDNTETHHIIETFTSTALCNESIAWHLSIDGGTVLSLTAASDRRHRIIQVFKKDYADRLIETSASDGDISIHLFMGKRDFFRHNRMGQYIFVNNRPIREPALARAIYNALEGLMPRELHPIFLLYINLPPSIVDFNVHPTKREVRFKDKEAIFKLLYRTAQRAIEPPINTLNTTSEVSHSLQTSTAETGYEHDRVQEQPLGYDYFSGLVDFIYLGDTFIAMSDNSGLAIIDYHAAHERINYERMLKRHFVTQPLLFPCTVELDALSYRAVVSNLTLLNELGLEIEDFGEPCVVVRALPEFFINVDIPSLIKDAALSIEAGKGFDDAIDCHSDPLELQRRRTAASLACHASIRGSAQRPDRANLSAILRDLRETERPDCCPHGRPTRINISQTDLKRMFKKS